MNGTPSANGEVVVKVNTTYLRLFQTIAGGIIALVLAVGGFIIRVEVMGATQHKDIERVLAEMTTMKADQAKQATAIEIMDGRVWDLKVQLTENQGEAEGQRRAIAARLSEVRTAIEEKIPEPKQK